MKKSRFKRVLLKVGGESLMGNREYGIDPETTVQVAKKIQAIHELGVEIAIVIGGGNIFRGLSASKHGLDRATGDYIGMLATVMNGLALQDALENLGMHSRLQSALQMPAVAESFIRRKTVSHLKKGRIVILVAGTGVPYVTTDTGAALHALELHCDVLMKATKVNGIFEKDPMKNPKAKRYKTLTFNDAIILPGVQAMDTAALAMCQENDMPVMVFKLFEKDNLERAIEGRDVGTYLSNEVKTALS